MLDISTVQLRIPVYRFGSKQDGKTVIIPQVNWQWGKRPHANYPGVKFYVPSCCQLKVFFICTLQSYIEEIATNLSCTNFGGNILAQSQCFSPNQMSACGLINMNHSSLVSRQWKYSNVAVWQH